MSLGVTEWQNLVRYVARLEAEAERREDEIAMRLSRHGPPAPLSRRARRNGWLRSIRRAASRGHAPGVHEDRRPGRDSASADEHATRGQRGRWCRTATAATARAPSGFYGTSTTAETPSSLLELQNGTAGSLHGIVQQRASTECKRTRPEFVRRHKNLLCANPYTKIRT